MSSYIKKSLDCTAQFKSIKRCKITKLEKEELAKQLAIRKAIVLKGKKKAIYLMNNLIPLFIVL